MLLDSFFIWVSQTIPNEDFVNVVDNNIELSVSGKWFISAEY